MNTVFHRIIWLVILLPVIYLAIIWEQIPGTVPMHADLHGNVDRYGSKNELMVLMIVLTVVNAILYIIVSNIYKIDPKKYAAQNKERLQRMAFYVSLYLSAIWIMIIYVTAFNRMEMTMKFVFIAMGILFALLGNNMYNIQPNYFAGIRLPWTLESEENWRKTHHLAGRLWFFGGLFFALLVFFMNETIVGIIGALLLAILIIVPVVYSYSLYKKSNNKN
ncbi:MAG: SdpI family protein [Bacteroidetes bacterium]|nr:SdpI family protein [Bacteroidota bacterium]